MLLAEPLPCAVLLVESRGALLHFSDTSSDHQLVPDPGGRWFARVDQGLDPAGEFPVRVEAAGVVAGRPDRVLVLLGQSVRHLSSVGSVSMSTPVTRDRYSMTELISATAFWMS